jgi:hypothetical protein
MVADPAISPDHPMGMDSADPRRWRALAVIAVAQLMIILDATIVNIALPTAQKELGITTADRQWVVTAYTLAFGGLLLLGGRIADYTGRKRTFIVGLIGFAVASAVGGLAPSAGWLFAARGLQAGAGLRRVWRDLRRRRGDRAHPGRRPHRVRVLALVPRRQYPHRPARRLVRGLRGAREQGAW